MEEEEGPASEEVAEGGIGRIPGAQGAAGAEHLLKLILRGRARHGVLPEPNHFAHESFTPLRFGHAKRAAVLLQRLRLNLLFRASTELVREAR